MNPIGSSSNYKIGHPLTRSKSIRKIPTLIQEGGCFLCPVGEILAEVVLDEDLLVRSLACVLCVLLL